MGEKSKIEWTDHTFNPWWGCERISPACDHCYAATFAKRLGFGWGKSSPVRTFEAKHWNEPRRWNAAAERAGKPALVFCASMADVFEDREGLDAERAKLWPLIEQTPHLRWLLLTKRPENVMGMVPESWQRGFPANVWMGATVEDQRRADERLDHLLDVPAAVHFVSAEPLLGAVDLHMWFAGPRRDGTDNFRGLAWVIAGGESGPKARPSHPDWFRSLRDQCSGANVPFHFKQWGEWAPLNDGPGGDVDLARYGVLPRAAGFFDYGGGWNGPEVPADRMRTNPFRQTMGLVGKKVAGRLLDGRTWDGRELDAQLGAA